MDLNAFDFDLDLEPESDLIDLTRYRRAMPPNAKPSTAAPSPAARPTLFAAPTSRSLTNSPGCVPAPATPAMARVLRKVRTDAWSAPTSTSWSRPPRALRKVARRAVNEGRGEPA